MSDSNALKTSNEIEIFTSDLSPFLKWPGGKSSELAKIASAAPHFTPDRFIDPFVGGGSVLLAVDPSIPAIVNDICPELIDLYRSGAENRPELKSELQPMGIGNMFGKLSNKRGLSFAMGFVLLSSLLLSNTQSSQASTLLKKSASSCASVDYYTNWVAKENLKKGDKGWQDVVKHGRPGTVSGWFDKTSVACGESVGLHLSGNNRPVSIKIYRMGYYAGAKARLVFSKTVGNVAKAPIPTIEKFPTHLTTTNWAKTTSITIDGNYPTGIYMARFDDGSKAGYAPLIVRNDNSKAGLIMVASTITWEAYNTYGGWSLYHGPDAKIYDPGRMVSFNRPYDRDGKSLYTVHDAGLVETAESLGLNISYTDDIYVGANPDSLLGHNGVVYDGHSEYWTAGMYKASTRARDAGVNLLFFGANSAYWKTRLENNGRYIAVWKNSTLEPYPNNPNMVTDKWGMGATPFNNSELLGALYAGIMAAPADYTVSDASSWPIKGTGLKNGDVIAGVVGKEVETTDMGRAPAVQSFLTSKIVSIEEPRSWNVGLVYYNALSNAGVVNVSTMGWVCNITDTCTWPSTANDNTKKQVIAITSQLLTGASDGPLALSHPVVANIPARTELQKICVLVCGSKTAIPDTN